MNIDTDTLVITVPAVIVAVLAVAGYARIVMRERKTEMANRINEIEDAYWREHEKIWARINHIERICREDSCRGKEYPVKNHYNTGV